MTTELSSTPLVVAVTALSDEATRLAEEAEIAKGNTLAGLLPAMS